MPSDPSRTKPVETVGRRVYDRAFWLAYASNGLSVTAFAMHFRFADFVDFLGGSATIIGLIWGVGMIGAAVARILVGWQADHRGLRWPWVSSAAVLVLSSAGFVFVDRVGPLIYVLRVAFSLALAAQFCCVVAFVWRGISVTRRAEAVGLLGTSGFIGMTLGPQIADVILGLSFPPSVCYKLLFAGATVFAVLDLLVAVAAVLLPSSAWSCTVRTDSLWQVLRAHWPVGVLPAALVMGITQSMHFNFLTRFVGELGLNGVGPFFAVYCMWALVVRVLGRKVPERLGLERTILVAITLLVLSGSLMATVHSLTGLLVVALIAGTSHAMLFPCTTALGASYFPLEYTVTGVACTLGLVDLANVVASPALGGIADVFGFRAMFLIASFGVAVCGVVFAVYHPEALLRGAQAARTPASGGHLRAGLPRVAYRWLPQKQREDAHVSEER